jgi:hypothetical protein
LDRDAVLFLLDIAFELIENMYDIFYFVISQIFTVQKLIYEVVDSFWCIDWFVIMNRITDVAILPVLGNVPLAELVLALMIVKVSDHDFILSLILNLSR